MDMAEYDYGKEDYAEYSQDPEYQEINDRLLEKDGLDSVEYDTVEMSDNEFTEAEAETTKTSDETSGEFTDEMSDNEFTEAAEEISETPDEANGEFSGDLPENEIHEDNEEINMVFDDMANDEAELPGDLSGFVDDSEFEDLVKADAPEYYESGTFYDQGINEYGFEGTCDPTITYYYIISVSLLCPKCNSFY